MNKQELIDKAVDDLKGEFPGRQTKTDTVYDVAFKCLYRPFFPHDEQFVCTKEEFTKRARELGWINGYKWGVEYETNGKKPDLPDDVLVDIQFEGSNHWQGGSVSLFAWSNVKYFQVIDQRYKPAKVEQLEPVNTLLEMLDRLNDKELYEVGQSKEAKSLVELLLKRKADDEKRAFVQKVVNALNYSHASSDKDIAELLYDAGCRFK